MQSTNLSPKIRVGMGIMAGVLLAAGIAYQLGIFSEQGASFDTEQEAIESNLRILNPMALGDRVTLAYANGTSGWLAVDEDAFAQLRDAQRRDDQHDLAQLAARALYKIPSGTQAVLLGSGDSEYTDRYKVRIIAGPQTGVEGWVHRFFLQYKPEN